MWTVFFDDEIPEEDRIMDRGADPGILSYTPYLQQNAQGETVRSLKFSHDAYCCTFCQYETIRQAVSCLYALFDQPIDLSEGEIVLTEDE